uniref:uncharacterized protein LOC109967606 n=1 Tax=Monopterus albus TaxID=43700 RepID=UPI0009B4BDF2|nr:uncharacterized protein LOC109967606 [Monopterus albus]
MYLLYDNPRLCRELVLIYAKVTFYETMANLRKDLFGDCTDKTVLQSKENMTNMLFHQLVHDGPPSSWDEPFDYDSSIILKHLIYIPFGFAGDVKKQRLSMSQPVNPSLSPSVLFEEAASRARSFYTVLQNWYSSRAESLVRLMRRRIEEIVRIREESADRSRCVVRLGRMRTEAAARADHSSSVNEESTDFSDEEMTRIKECVYTAVNKLISRIEEKPGVKVTEDQLHTCTERLFYKTWTLLEGERFDFNAETFQHLEKNVYKDLCKKFSNANTQFELLLKGTSGEDYVASNIKKHIINPPKKGNKVCRFFSDVRKSICKVSRKLTNRQRPAL